MTDDSGVSECGWISGREAARELATIGMHRRQARRLLDSGLAGEPVRTPSVDLYDRAVVRELTRRRALTGDDVDEACPHGLFIARRDLDPALPETQRRAAVASGWGFSPWTGVFIAAQVQLHGHLPLVATVCGFVVVGAEIVGLGCDDDGYRFELRPPGAWYDALAPARLLAGPGRAWMVRGWQPLARGTMTA